MTKQTEPSTFNHQLDQLTRGEAIADETPDLAFARRLHKTDLSSRSRIEASLRAELLAPEYSPAFQRVPTSSHKRMPLSRRVAPTLAFGAAMVLLVWFLAWVLTNTTPQPAIPEETTKGFSLLVLDYQGVICCGEGRAAWLDAETLQVSQELNIPFARGIVAAPDGRVIFDQGFGEQTFIASLDLQTGEQTPLVTAPEIVAPMGNYPAPFAISPDGTRLVVAHYDSVVALTRYWRSVFDLTTNTLMYKLPEEPEYVDRSETPSCLGAVLMISPDANYLHELCFSSGLPRIRMIDLNSGEILRILPILYAWDAILSPDGSLMYVFTSLGEILVLNTQNLETIKTFESESLVTDYGGGRRTAISQDGMTLFVSTYALTGKHQFFAIDTQSGDIITQIEGDGSIDSIVVAPDNQTVFTLALLDGGKAVVTAHDPVTLEAKYRRVFEGEFIPKRLIGVAVDMVPRVPFETSTTTTPSSSLPGDLFFLLRPTSPPFYYQWAHLPAFCLEDRVDCDLQMLPALPDGEAIPDIGLSWSPDGTRALFFNNNAATPTLYELTAATGAWRAIPVDFWVMQEKYFWTFDSQWVAFQAQGEGAYTSYIGFLNPATGEFRKLNEIPGEERDPLGWLSENELLVQVLKYDPNGGGKQTFPDVRYVRLEVQTGQETEYTEVEGPGPRLWDGNAFPSPDGQWFAVGFSDGGTQTEIVLMRPDGSENHAVFQGSGGLNGVLWLNDEYLFVRLYNETTGRNHLYLISLADNTAREITLPGLDTAAFDISQVSFRPNAAPPFGGTSVAQFPTPTPYPTHAPTTGDPLTVLQALTAKHASDMLSGSGWLHIQARNYYTGEESDPLPHGDPIPNPSISDSWFQLDEQRQVVRAVYLFTDENGQINQVSIQRDGQSINLTLGEQSPADPFNLNFDLDFAEKAANLVATGQTLHMSDLYFEGQYAGVVFNIQTENGFEWEALFDPDTGQLRSLIRYQLVSGGKALQQSTNILVEEWVGEPPADILAYLDQEFQPYAPLPPLGTPAPEGFDASHSDLNFKMVNGDDINRPTFFYVDIYAEGYMLGRFDSGGVPGGWCDRSFDGAYLAFNYTGPEPAYLTTLRWFNVNDVTNILEPFPDLQQQSPPAFAPGDLRMAFGACNGSSCGYYIYALQTGELVKLVDGPAYAHPAWTPDGKYLTYLLPVSEENTDTNRGTVIRVDTGEVVFTGSTNEIFQTYGVTVPTGASGLSCESAPDPGQSTQPELNPYGTYTVQEGDTLFKIAYDFGLTIETLLSLNGLTFDSTITVGQVLIVAPPTAP